MVPLVLQVEFGSCLIKFNSSFLNTLIEEEFRIFIPRLFHSDITVGKRGLMPGFKTRDFVALRTSCSVRYCLEELAEQDTMEIFYEFCKISIIFLTNLDFKDSKPNSWKSFSEDVPFIAPVIAMAALY